MNNLRVVSRENNAFGLGLSHRVYTYDNTIKKEVFTEFCQDIDLGDVRIVLKRFVRDHINRNYVDILCSKRIRIQGCSGALIEHSQDNQGIEW